MESRRDSMKSRVGRNHLENTTNVLRLNTWSYLTEHSLMDLLSPGFFNLMVGALGLWDRIVATASCETEKPEHATLVVTAVEQGAGVTVELLREATEPQS